jgi:hypothetical protein
MAISAVNATWAGQTGISTGELLSQGGLTGSAAKALYGVGTFILDGATTTGLTLNFIDGVQVPFKQTGIIQLQSVTAPATINGVANVAIYSGVGAMGQLRVGQSITTAGFSNSGNNSTTLVVLSITTNSFSAVNASSVAETNPAGTASFTLVQGAAGPAAAYLVRSVYGPFNNVLDTAANTIQVTLTAITPTGVTFTISAAGTSLQTLSVAIELFPSN